MTAEYGAPSDMVYKDILRAEEYRRTVEKIDVFNAASSGTIVLESDPARQLAEGGDFTDTGRWKPISGLISRRDNENPGNIVGIKKLEMSGGRLVRQTLGCGPVSITDIQARKAGRTFDMNSAMVNLGQQFADAKLVRIRDNALAAACAAADNLSAHVLDVARGKTAGSKVTCSMAYINQMLALMGDAREQVAAFVMPSAVFADLVGDTISNYQFDRAAGVSLYKDVVQAFGRAVLVVDAPALVATNTSGYYTDYTVLGLGVGAVAATIIHDAGLELQRDILRESSVSYVREDFDVEYEIFGAKWNSVTDNPTDGEIATASNWATDYEDHREFKVVKGVFNASV
jgi:hypothetical protein